MQRRIVLICTLLLAVGMNEAAAELRRAVAAGDLIVVNAWMPQPVGGAKAGVIYLGIENKGNEADQLVGADSPGAQQLMLHESKDSGDVMKMLPLNAVEIPGHGKVELRPMGIHLMVTGLKTAPRQSDIFPLILKFSRAGTVAVDVVVQAPNVLKPVQ
jgi:periplasmic copper chaperone A